MDRSSLLSTIAGDIYPGAGVTAVTMDAVLDAVANNVVMPEDLAGSGALASAITAVAFGPGISCDSAAIGLGGAYTGGTPGDGSATFAKGNCTVDGGGNLTAATLNSDAGQVSTDGGGDISCVSISGTSGGEVTWWSIGGTGSASFAQGAVVINEYGFVKCTGLNLSGFSAPAHSTSIGTAGEIGVAVDGGGTAWLYYCIASGHWVRIEFPATSW
jgi:hypothetical protein